jgi:hypothetical protein
VRVGNGMARNLQNRVIDISVARASHPFRPHERNAAPCSIRQFSPRPHRVRQGWAARALELLRRVWR